MSSISGNINDVFFNSSYKQAWKNIIPPGLTEAEVDFLMDIAHLRSGSTVLDLMCGYGRHALGLARKGVEVTAVDNLEDYIKEIRLVTEKEELPVTTIASKVLDLNISDRFDCVICMGNSFAFFDRTDAMRLLKNCAANLKKDGVMIINTWMIAEIAIRHFRQHDWHYAGEYKCLLDYQFKFHPSRIESEQTIISPDGTIEVIKGVDYIFTLNELAQMCEEAGLQITKTYSSPRKKPFSIGDNQAYILISPFNSPV